MKLRLRSFNGKELTRLEVPDPCTVHQLQRILHLHLSMLPQLPPSSIRFSLNLKDEVRASSTDDTLRSLGISSGDLLFYKLDHSNSDSAGNAASPSPNPRSSDRIDSGDASKGYEYSSYGSASATTSDFSLESYSFDSQDSVSSVVSDDSPSSVDCETRNQTSAVLDVQNDMDVDGNDNVEVFDKFSVPYFLRRVLRKELNGDKVRDDHRLLVLAVHTVMLESGFVCVDPVTKMSMGRFYVPEIWPSFAFSISLHYSFPEIPLGLGRLRESVELVFQSLGQFMNVYGSLDKGKSDLRRVCLNERAISPKIESLLLSRDHNTAKEVFEFWNEVADNLALPLSMDLSERAGLNLRSCFTCLPVELKTKILESMTGIDLAKVGCVCSELLYLSTNNDLWKQKCIEEFGGAVKAFQDTASRAASFSWKQIFQQSWKTKKTVRARRLYSIQQTRFGGNYGPFPLPLLGIPNLHILHRSIMIHRHNLGGDAGR